MQVENSKLEAEVERMQAALAADKSMANAAHKALASASEIARSWSENLGESPPAGAVIAAADVRCRAGSGSCGRANRKTTACSSGDRGGYGVGRDGQGGG